MPCDKMREAPGTLYYVCAMLRVYTLLHFPAGHLPLLQLGFRDLLGHPSPVDTNGTTCSKPKLQQQGIKGRACVIVVHVNMVSPMLKPF